MCMLTYLPPNIQPDQDALLNGMTFNRDGHGYAIVVPETDTHKARIIVRHSLNGKGLVKRFAHDRRKYPHGPALFHSRFGTSGAQTKFNCHPFQVNHDRQTVVAHNGILPTHMHPDKTDRRCDTRLAADDHFTQNYGHLNNESARNRLAVDIQGHNKLVILTINPQYDQYAYIINEEYGVWDETNIWYSNYDYESRQIYAYPLNDNDDTDCSHCQSKNSVGLTNICDMCYTCTDCDTPIDDCLCYPPAQGYKDTDYTDPDQDYIEWWTKNAQETVDRLYY